MAKCDLFLGKISINEIFAYYIVSIHISFDKKQTKKCLGKAYS